MFCQNRPRVSGVFYKNNVIWYPVKYKIYFAYSKIKKFKINKK